MGDADRMRELGEEGFFCSQILIIVGMEWQGKDNPDLVRAVHALAGGIGFTGETCGALTGGACLLGLYAGRGKPTQQDNPRLMFMVGDLVKWFQQEYGQTYGGIRCGEILNDNSENMVTRCPSMVLETLQKVKVLLGENGFDLAHAEE